MKKGTDMKPKKSKLSNSKLLALIESCRAHSRQLDSAGSRGEYALSSSLLEQAAAAIEQIMKLES